MSESGEFVLPKSSAFLQRGSLALRSLSRSGWWQMVYLLGVAGLAYLRFANWAYDDPFITYRYAANLMHGLGPVYNPGERVLSTTTPLFMLLLASLGHIWPDLPHLANWIGAISLALGGLCLWELGRAWETPLTGWAGLLLFPSFPLLLSTLGSETPVYVAACLGTLVFYARRNLALCALLAACAALIRPDGILVTLPLIVDYLVHGKRAIPWKPLLLFLGLVLPWHLFAWAYYGSPLPVTLAAKQHQAALAASQRFGQGLILLVSSYAGRWYYWLAAALALVGLVILLRRARRWGLLLGWTALYLVAYLLLGVTRYFWYYAPLVPGFVMLVGLGLWGLSQVQLPAERRWLRSVGWVLPAGLLLVLTFAQCRSAWALGARQDRRVAVYRAVGDWLRVNAEPEDRVGALEVGVIGYYSRQPMIDFAGLIQPATADRLGPDSGYAEVAVWAMDQYRPKWAVALDGSLPQLEQGYLPANCGLAEHFPGEAYGLSTGVTIYICQ